MSMPEETYGDDQSLSCPYCGLDMGPFEGEDLIEEDAEIECKHCNRPVALSIHRRISITAQCVVPAEASPAQAPQDPDEATSIDTRKLVYDFLVLPTLSRRSVMGRLGFPDYRDSITPEEELGCRFFGWVRENKLIERLQAEIAKASP